jgi:biofilm PGA synthesis N-glycosyltransferase PgaC
MSSASLWPLLTVASLVAILYTYLGYPLILGLLARGRRHPARPDPTWEPRVTVCIAAYNAAAYLDRKLASVTALAYPEDKLEILVYSDGSTDLTEAIVAGWAARDRRVRLLDGNPRRGKPTALNAMRAQATGEVLLLTDTRQPVSPGALRALVTMLADPRVGAVSGNLVLDGPAGSGLYWKYENWIRRQEARFRSVVGMTGPLSILRRADLEPLAPDLILDDFWIPMRLRLQGRYVLFCEAAIAHDDAFEDDREFGRKTRTLAGNYQAFGRMPRLLLPFVNPSWFETVSHKILRLVCPWALVLLLAASAAALAGARPGPAAKLLATLLVGQLVFYGLALLGARSGRIGRLARTFVVLNAAALVGLWRFMTGRQKITW